MLRVWNGCAVLTAVFETFPAEAFAKIKMSLKHTKTGKRQTWKRKDGLSSPHPCGCHCTCPALSPQHRYPFTTGSNEDSLLHNFSGRALPPTSLKRTCSLYFFLTLLAFEGQISDPQNTRAGFQPDFWIRSLFWEALEEPWERGCLCELSPPQLTKTALQTRCVVLAGIPQVLLSLFSITLESGLF